MAEGLASRGDRRMGAVIERVWRAGGTFQEWSERFDLALWESALAAEGLQRRRGARRGDARRQSRPCPGCASSGRGCTGTSSGVTGRTPWPRVSVEDCRWTPCYDCGACTGFGLEHVVASPVPPAGGSQGTGQDLSTGDRIPVRLVSRVSLRTAGAASACASRRRGRSVSRAVGTWPGMWERALRRSRPADGLLPGVRRPTRW